MSEFDAILDRFNALRALVVGDVFLDQNTYGAMTGISLEAPIPIFEVHDRRCNPGAAANTACNVAALGAQTAMLGVVGRDANADTVREELQARGVDPSLLVVDPEGPTNTYGKFRAGTYNATSQEVLRVDTPRPPGIQGAVEEDLLTALRARAADVDVIIAVDQIGSVVTQRVIDAVASVGEKHGALTVGDSRGNIGAFRGFALLAPNDREAADSVGLDIGAGGGLDRVVDALLGVAAGVMITRGPEGVYWAVREGGRGLAPATVEPEAVVDVTGAGDTATAMLALATAAGASPEQAACLANVAAGQAVRRRGVVTVPVDEVRQALAPSRALSEKVKGLDELRGVVARHQAEGRRVVWTNGCFDLLHSGHISYLMRAASLGDVLVVGLNSDASVRENKGPHRPVIQEDDRCRVLAALECVDYVTVFSDKTTVPILEALRPDVYVKGGDYALDTINQEERRCVEGYGGAIELVPGVAGRSTTTLIERIISRGVPGA